MPRGDGTGPAGQGRMTGRGMGFCAGFNAPGFMNYSGRGLGRGMGFGRGYGWRRFSTEPVVKPTKEQEKNILESQVKMLESDQEQITQEISDLKKRIEEMSNRNQ